MVLNQHCLHGEWQEAQVKMQIPGFSYPPKPTEPLSSEMQTISLYLKGTSRSCSTWHGHPWARAWCYSSPQDATDPCSPSPGSLHVVCHYLSLPDFFPVYSLSAQTVFIDDLPPLQNLSIFLHSFNNCFCLSHLLFYFHLADTETEAERGLFLTDLACKK